MITDEGKKLATELKDADSQNDLIQACYDAEAFVDHLSNACQNPALKGDLNAIVVGKEAKAKLNILGQKITQALVQRVADEFIDINQPIKKLVEVATGPQNIKNKQGILNLIDLIK